MGKIKKYHTFFDQEGSSVPHEIYERKNFKRELVTVSTVVQAVPVYFLVVLLIKNRFQVGHHNKSLSFQELSATFPCLVLHCTHVTKLVAPIHSQVTDFFMYYLYTFRLLYNH